MPFNLVSFATATCTKSDQKYRALQKQINKGPRVINTSLFNKVKTFKTEKTRNCCPISHLVGQL